MGHLLWAIPTTCGLSISCPCSDAGGPCVDASHGTSPPLPHQGGHKEGCPRSQDDRIAAGHVANRETKAGKEAELVPASQSQQHIADRQNHTLHHPCSGRPLGTGCIRCGQLQLGKSLARTGAAWDRIRVSLRSEVSLAGHSGAAHCLCPEDWSSWMSAPVWGMGGLTQAPWAHLQAWHQPPTHRAIRDCSGTSQ